MSDATRIETDPLGELAVPQTALYGVQTARALENFPISGLRALPQFVVATIGIPQAIASCKTRPNPSSIVGSTKTEACVYRSRSSALLRGRPT